MNRVGFALVAAGALSVLGCNDGDEPPPVDRCNSLTTAYATRTVDCFVEEGCIAAGDRNATYKEVMSELNKMARSCSSVVAVKSNFDQCLTETEAQSCDAYADSTTGGCRVPVMPSCAGVLQY